MGRAIMWDELVHTYGPTHRLASVLGIFISYFLMPNKGQHILECGWGKILQMMLETLERYGWGQCMLAHIYHEMHEIVYHERKSMAVGVYVLRIWAWEHLLVTRPIFEDER